MMLKQYDKVRLKDGRTATIVDILEENVAYIVDIDLPSSDWETVEIRRSDILSAEVQGVSYESYSIRRQTC